jgi:hypothetical protein
MALRLYRRHRKECEAGRPEDFKSGEFEGGRRGWKRCGCPIHASGTIRGNFKRQSTGQWEWDAAKAVAAQWESTETWCELPLMEAVEPYQQTTAQPAAPTIPEATEAFLSKCETRHPTDDAGEVPHLHQISSTRTRRIAATSELTSSRSSIWTAFTPHGRTRLGREPKSSNG